MSFRGSPFAFDSPARAIDALCAELQASRSDSERVPLHEATGRVLAQDVALDRDSPPFDNSMMDGYAVRRADLPSAGTFRMEVSGEARIGQAPPRMQPGAATRIATGAPIPIGADLVLPRERVREGTEPVREIEGSVDPANPPRIGEHVRRRGENARAGSIVLCAGECLSPAGIGTLASVGCRQPVLRARLRVAVLVTGEELVSAQAEPGPHAIRDSNGPALVAALGSRRWIETGPSLHEGGEAETLVRRLRDLADAQDAIVISGGISMGHRDPVRAALETLGARCIFHGLPQRPGKPVLGATLDQAGRRLAILALPGNPLSAMVCCERIVIPVLARLAGAHRPAPPAVRIARTDGRSLSMWWHRLVRIGTDGSAELVELQGSGDIPAGGRSDGFVELPPGETGASGDWPFHAWPR